MKPRAFSLVELVIVVVIIGIISAIAVPRVSRATKGANEAALRANLAALRNAIDLFAAEHGGQWPGASGVATAFWSQLRSKTNAGGQVGTTAGVHIYGPYIRSRVAVPVGPNAGASGVVMTTSSPATSAVDEALTMRGWVFNYQTGEFVANTDDVDEAGDAFSEY